MRVMRVTLLMLPLALLLSAAAFGAPANESTLTTKQLEEAIFGSSGMTSSASTPADEAFGVCDVTCDPCWSNADCPKIGTRIQRCVWACN
jgi:hypothetical protein